MPDIFILRLRGPLQSWGGHTYEDHRPTHLFPTRSGLAGLLAACLGVRRVDAAALEAVCEGFRFCVRLDRSQAASARITDFHTIENARKADGGIDKNPVVSRVVSRRQYLCDARFTAALALSPEFPFPPERLEAALRAPVFTPVLGRRSCPLSAPLFERRLAAASLLDALREIPPGAGTVYGEEPGKGAVRLLVRDAPLGGGRRFASREVFLHAS